MKLNVETAQALCNLRRSDDFAKVRHLLVQRRNDNMMRSIYEHGEISSVLKGRAQEDIDLIKLIDTAEQYLP